MENNERELYKTTMTGILFGQMVMFKLQTIVEKFLKSVNVNPSDFNPLTGGYQLKINGDDYIMSYAPTPIGLQIVKGRKLPKSKLELKWHNFKARLNAKLHGPIINQMGRIDVSKIGNAALLLFPTYPFNGEYQPPLTYNNIRDCDPIIEKLINELKTNFYAEYFSIKDYVIAEAEKIANDTYKEGMII